MSLNDYNGNLHFNEYSDIIIYVININKLLMGSNI